MLNINQINLNDNLLLIEEHPVIVQETISGVHRDPKDIDREKAARLFRTGVVKSEGILSGEVLSSFSTIGKDNQRERLNLNTLVGQTVLYMANGIDVVDIPVEDSKRLVSINALYIHSLIKV